MCCILIRTMNERILHAFLKQVDRENSFGNTCKLKRFHTKLIEEN